LDLTSFARRVPWAVPAAALLTVVLWPGMARGALWYDFNEPYASATAPEVKVYDWSAQKCIQGDIPDQPARAFRNQSGQVSLIDTQASASRAIGSSLDAITHQCTTMFSSGFNSDPAAWDGAEVLHAPYTPDGTTVYALVHNEYWGWTYGPGYCIRPGELWDQKQKCWQNAVTLAISTNGGTTFSHATPPNHYVATLPYRYEVGVGPVGFFNPSNIQHGKDGYYYTLVHVQGQGVQSTGACLWRTRDLSDRMSWRAWSGSGFTVRFLDPYVNNITDPAQHVCAPVGPTTIQTGTESLTWNTYFKKWLLVRATGGGGGTGFYTYTSDDLINWSGTKLMTNAELPWTHTCGEPDYVLYPSLLDPESKSRNFEDTGQRPYLFFTHFNVAYNSGGCYMSLDRDLLRIPIEFSNQVPGGPAAALATSTTSVRTGEPITFDASGSRDADGSIAKYEWDLDGDGIYERDTGTNPVTQTSYRDPDKVTVTVRVSDNEGKATDQTTIVRITGPALGASGGKAATAGFDSPAAAVAAVRRFRLAGKPRARRDGSVVISVHAPAAGRLAVRGARVRAASATAARPGTLSLRVKTSARGRAILARRGRVLARTRLTFTPVGGAPQSETHAIVFRKRR
jgi:hypothetical protein